MSREMRVSVMMMRKNNRALGGTVGVRRLETDAHNEALSRLVCARQVRTRTTIRGVTSARAVAEGPLSSGTRD